MNDCISTHIDSWTSISTSCPSSCSVGMEEQLFSSMDIYPNPTNGNLSITLEEGTASSVTIRNSLGQILLHDKSLSRDQLKLGISAYPKGLYFLQLEVDGELITKKVVKE